MLELKDLHKTFNPGTVNAKTALDGLSLTLWDGEFVIVIGGNGAGKSTMLNAAGTLSVDSGEVHLDGVDVTDLPEYKRAAYIGRMFQDPMMGTAPSMHISPESAATYSPVTGPCSPDNTLFFPFLIKTQGCSRGSSSVSLFLYYRYHRSGSHEARWRSPPSSGRS